MSLLSLCNVSFTWGGPLLLNGIDPDSGEIRGAAGLRVARLVQEVPQGGDGRVVEIVAEGCTGSVGDSADETDDSIADGSDADNWKVGQAGDRVLSRHSKYVTFQLAELAVTRNLFAAILDRIAQLALPPPVVAGCGRVEG